jgi:hypothetical protein
MSHGPSGLGGATLRLTPACLVIIKQASGSVSASASIITRLILVFMFILLLFKICLFIINLLLKKIILLVLYKQ